MFTSKFQDGYHLVRHLKTDSRYWNVSLLKNNFIDEDVQAILSIPTSVTSKDDSFCWHFTNDGEYTVKSGFRVSLSLDISGSSSGVQGPDVCWKTIWKLELPSKIKIFLCRACHDWIPTSINLARRKVPVSGMCPVCSSSFETTVHALWCCSGLKVVRFMFGSLNGWNGDTRGSFQDFLGHSLSEDQLILLCIVLWRVWFLRNQLLRIWRITLHQIC